MRNRKLCTCVPSTESSPGGSLTTLSIGGCSLAATDVVPLCQAIRNGLKLQMLKVSSNRLESKGVIELVEAVLSNNTHPLAVLDVSDNTVRGRDRLANSPSKGVKL